MKWNNTTKIRIYLLSICFISALTFTYFCIFRGDNFHQIFHADVQDIFMDHFNVVSLYTVCDPYESYLNSYPAFVNIILEIFAHFIPYNYRDSLSPHELRENQYAMMVFLIYLLLCIWAFSSCIKVKMKFDNITDSIFTLSMLLSYPMLFTLERGNIIILAFIFTLFFVFFRNSNHKIVREISYIFLAFAASIKIYPAFLGLFLIKEKKIKDTIRLLIYGIFTFFAPFFVMFDGITSIKYMLKGLFEVVTYDRGCGYQYSLSNFFTIVSKITKIEIPTIITTILLCIVMTCLIVSFFVVKEEWKQVLALILPMILLPGFSAAYVLIFLFIPFSLFISKIYNQENIVFIDKLYAFLFFVIFAPFLSFVLPQFSNDIYVFTCGMMIHYIALMGFIFLLVKESFYNLKNLVQ